jgi:hypothetical protein
MERLEADLPHGVSPGATATEAITAVAVARASDRCHMAQEWLCGRKPADAVRELLAAADPLLAWLRDAVATMAAMTGEDGLPGWHAIAGNATAWPSSTRLARAELHKWGRAPEPSPAAAGETWTPCARTQWSLHGCVSSVGVAASDGCAASGWPGQWCAAGVGLQDRGRPGRGTLRAPQEQGTRRRGPFGRIPCAVREGTGKPLRHGLGSAGFQQFQEGAAHRRGGLLRDCVRRAEFGPLGEQDDRAVPGGAGQVTKELAAGGGAPAGAVVLAVPENVIGGCWRG